MKTPKKEMNSAPGQEGLVMFDGVQLVRGGVAALAWELPLRVVGPRAARDVDVAPTQVPAAFEGRRGGGDAVDDDARREKVRVLKQVERKKKAHETELVSGHPSYGLSAFSISTTPGR